ncbi:hypothetical protein DFH07DRAFT_787407 [Mycena maculata]|uniref:Uncharacterized protein n=1 Tax=Mycena maculata TaxID=230809 RepID=A0AAD7KGV9_9AGAR|nr:hypothetical protein DFH07DRAFT_787407 [Mycena maculata]
MGLKSGSPGFQAYTSPCLPHHTQAWQATLPQNLSSCGANTTNAPARALVYPYLIFALNQPSLSLWISMPPSLWRNSEPLPTRAHRDPQNAASHTISSACIRARRSPLEDPPRVRLEPHTYCCYARLECKLGTPGGHRAVIASPPESARKTARTGVEFLHRIPQPQRLRFRPARTVVVLRTSACRAGWMGTRRMRVSRGAEGRAWRQRGRCGCV